jgi:tetratricopeptide (TPR) repeat protein
MNQIGMCLAKAWFEEGKTAEAETMLVTLLLAMIEDGGKYNVTMDGIILADLLAHYHRSGMDEVALEWCRRCEPIFRAHPLFILYRGVTQLRRSKFAAALADFDRFEDIFQSGRLESAVPLTLCAEELWNWQGICHLAFGNTAEARNCFSKSNHRDPENLEYRARLRIATAAVEKSADATANLGRNDEKASPSPAGGP